jgi:hypothetical protein
MTKVYKGVSLDHADPDDTVKDISGYIGVFHRKGALEESQMNPITWPELAHIFAGLEENERNV